MTITHATPTKTTFKKFRFTYRFDGADWNIEIPATSLEEAKDRVKVLTFARYENEAPASVSRLANSERYSSGWFTNALRSI